MRKQTIGLAAALLGGAMAVPALADVTVYATIDKQKEVLISERLDITKRATVVVLMGTPGGTTELPIIVPKDFKAAAEADAIVNVVNRDNTVGPELEEPGNNVKRTNTISTSINLNRGIVGVNQDTGDNNNQGNVVALAFTDFDDSLVNAQAAVDQLNTGNDVSHTEVFPVFDEELPPTSIPASVFHTNVELQGSVNFNIGIVGVNQNGGNNNNQTNAVAVAAGLDAGLALAETALGQENSDNHIEEVNTFKREVIGGSVNNNIGIVSVNQSAGNNNNQSGAVSIAASTTAVHGLIHLGNNNAL